MILILSIILFLLLLIVAKERGFKTFICFYLNYFLIISYIIFMGIGFNAIVLALITCLIASAISLFLLNGDNIKTRSSFKAVLIILFIMFIIILFIGKNSNIQGFSYESIETIGVFSFDINYNMTDVIIGMFMVCIIGTITDTSISISSALNEIHQNNKKIQKKELFESGMNVGKDILSTTINTLYFAFIGGFIGFIIWHYSSNLEFIINYKAFASDMIELLLCFISSILIIPTTAYITSNNLIKNSTNTKI